MQGDPRHAVVRFIVPVTLENVVTVLVGIVFSTLMGRISASALAATNTANLVVSLYVSMFSLLTTGSAVLTARLIGARETREASRTVEQSILMTIALSCAFALLSIAGAPLIMRLSMPSAGGQLYAESVRYFRVLSFSLPGLILWNVLMSVLRASGNSRAPLFTAAVVNISQIAFAYLFIAVFPMGVMGAALSFVLCRVVGGVMAFVLVLRSRQSFFVRLKHLVRPHMPTIRRIVRIGLPTSFEQTFIQIGYVVANMLVVGLGTAQATVYNVANSLNSFANIPLSIASALSTTFVGQMIGAGKYKEAKRFGIWNLVAFMPLVLAMYFAVALFSPSLSAFFTDDAAVIAGSTSALWVLVWYAAPVMSVNVVDPCLRAGGDVNWVMIQTFVGVWLVRLPLTWLFGYVFHMGINGINAANIISLSVRALIGLARFSRDKWLYKRV